MKIRWLIKAQSTGLIPRDHSENKVLICIFFLPAGVITGVDVNTAYSWPACTHCGSDSLERLAGKLYVQSNDLKVERHEQP